MVVKKTGWGYFEIASPRLRLQSLGIQVVQLPKRKAILRCVNSWHNEHRERACKANKQQYSIDLNVPGIDLDLGRGYYYYSLCSSWSVCGTRLEITTCCLGGNHFTSWGRVARPQNTNDSISPANLPEPHTFTVGFIQLSFLSKNVFKRLFWLLFFQTPAPPVLSAPRSTWPTPWSPATYPPWTLPIMTSNPPGFRGWMAASTIPEPSRSRRSLGQGNSSSNRNSGSNSSWRQRASSFQVRFARSFFPSHGMDLALYSKVPDQNFHCSRASELVKFHTVQQRRWTDFEALKLWNVRSGRKSNQRHYVQV